MTRLQCWGGAKFACPSVVSCNTPVQRTVMGGGGGGGGSRSWSPTLQGLLSIYGKPKWTKFGIETGSLVLDTQFSILDIRFLILDTRFSIHTHTHTHTHTHKHTRMHSRTHTHVRMHTHSHTYTHTCKHTLLHFDKHHLIYTNMYRIHALNRKIIKRIIIKLTYYILFCYSLWGLCCCHGNYRSW